MEKKKDESGDKNQKKKLERQEEKLKLNNRELSMVFIVFRPTDLQHFNLKNKKF